MNIYKTPRQVLFLKDSRDLSESLESTLAEKRGGAGKKAKAGRQHRPPASVRSSELVDLLALDESFFQHLLVTEPQIGDIG
jgi:hypothetical protein